MSTLSIRCCGGHTRWDGLTVKCVQCVVSTCGSDTRSARTFKWWDLVGWSRALGVCPRVLNMAPVPFWLSFFLCTVWFKSFPATVLTIMTSCPSSWDKIQFSDIMRNLTLPRNWIAVMLKQLTLLPRQQKIKTRTHQTLKTSAHLWSKMEGGLGMTFMLVLFYKHLCCLNAWQ